MTKKWVLFEEVAVGEFKTKKQAELKQIREEKLAGEYRSFRIEQVEQ